MYVPFGFRHCARRRAAACSLGRGVKEQKAVRATAPEKMTRSGEGDAMRKSDQMAMDQHIAMADHTRFVKDCVAKKMKR
jgi:hypothetical protein